MKMHRTMVLVCVMLATVCGRGEAAIRYVDANVSGGANNGSSWANAYTTLTNAISASGAGDEIWVAQGTYYPAAAGSRTASFELKAGMSLYGGFTNGMGTLGERNWSAYPAILSGDIDQDGVTLDPDNTENVVKANTNTTLDGLTVAWGYESDGKGGGLLISSKTNVTIRNCLFRDSYARLGGAGVYVVSGSPVTVEACEFANNIGGWTNATSEGGGLLAETTSGTIRNSLFRGNRTSSYTPIYKTGRGGAMQLGGATTWTIDNCVFAGNYASYWAGAINLFHVTTLATIRNCQFYDNQATSYAGVIGTASQYHRVTIEDCLFVGNRSEGNTGSGAAGALYDFAGTLRNCLFAGNYAYANGGAIYCYSPGATQAVENCTFAYNYAKALGGAVCYGGTVAGLTNNIFWGNESVSSGKEINGGSNPTGVITFCYTDVQGGYNGSRVVTNKALVINAGGNTNVNPLFAGGINGSWTADAVYDAAAGKSTLTDGNAAWTPNQWAQTFVNPNTNLNRQFFILSNSATALFVWGNASALLTTDASVQATNGARYQGYDYHLKSQYGRWTAGGWVNDTTNSPLIDAGHPDFTYSREPNYNGGRINIGVYGNTAQASKSKSASGTLIMIK